MEVSLRMKIVVPLLLALIWSLTGYEANAHAATNAKPAAAKAYIGTPIRIGYSIQSSPDSTNCVNPGDLVWATFTFMNTSSSQGMYFQAQPGEVTLPDVGDVDGIFLADGTSRLIPTPDGNRWVFGIAAGHTVVKRLHLQVGQPNEKLSSPTYNATVVVYRSNGPASGIPMTVTWKFCTAIAASAL